MLQAVQALILKVIKYGETSIIVQAFTVEYGLRSFIAKGVRQSKYAHKAAILKPLGIVEMQVYHKPLSEIDLIKEMKWYYVYLTMYSDPFKQATAMVLSEWLLHILKSVAEPSILFHFIQDKLILFDKTKENYQVFILGFMYEMMIYLGVQPAFKKVSMPMYFDMRAGVFCEEMPLHFDVLDISEANLLEQLMRYNTESIIQVSIPSDQQSILLDILLRYYRLHVHDFGILQSVAIYKKLIN